ncbi:hypothetical protein SLEP1_g49133 [Rubroshorea leprosula]|uniref:Uncharacterized protein n=1 Tax=Rubroshorea leprosula TaxID=152421 RepID=A0AAV5LWR5_9ROSI|nr:hypothetical protein SLEP1_g49133 [Rubroshorea leprosula]
MALLLSTTMNNLRPKLFCHSSGSVNENPATMFRLFTGLNVKNNKREKFSIIGLAIKNPSGSQTTERIHGKITPRKGKGPVLSEGRDEDENYGPVCPGCGVFMQDKDPNFPGYYKKRRVITKEVLKDEDGGEEGFEGEIEGFSDEEGEEFWDGIEGKLEGSDSEGDDMEEGDEFDWDSDEWEAKFLKEEDESEFDGFAPAGVGYGNITEETIEKKNADEIWKNHVGVRLQPPIGNDRVSELGKWEDREVKVSGTSWVVNSVDIAAAGLGWFSLGLKGEASFTLWTYDGIEITTREPLVLDRAPFIERPGFWLPKAISDAIGNQTRSEAKKKKLQEESLFNQIGN